MQPQPPVLLVDNLFDTITCYAGAALTASSESPGREARRVADYRRDRTWWQPAVAGPLHTLSVDLTPLGLTRPVDAVYLDRGHTLWGLPLSLLRSADGTTFTDPLALGAVPARAAGGGYVPGGDPAVEWCVTEEGACYRFLPRQATAAGWQLAIDTSGAGAGLLPRVSGVVLGVRHQFFGFSDVFDDDARARKLRSEESDAGHLGTGPTYSWRTADLSLRLIGDPEYDGVLRGIAALMFDRNQPGVLVWDAGTRPERAWMGTVDGQAWGFAKRKAYREGRLRLREHGHRVTFAGALIPVPPPPPPQFGAGVEPPPPVNTPLVPGKIVGDGNSLLAGVGIDNSGTSFLDGNIIQRLGVRYACPAVNFGGSGQGTQAMLDDAATQIDPAYDATKTPDVLVLWELRNEYVGRAKQGTVLTAQQVLDLMWTYVDARRAAHPWAVVVVLPVLPTTDAEAGLYTNANYETWRQDINAKLVAQAPAHGCRVPTLSDAVMAYGANHNRAYYAEDIHLNGAGYALVEPDVAAEIDAGLAALSIAPATAGAWTPAALTIDHGTAPATAAVAGAWTPNALTFDHAPDAAVAGTWTPTPLTLTTS